MTQTMAQSVAQSVAQTMAQVMAQAKQKKKTVSQMKKKIILAIKNNPNITTTEMMQVIGKSRRTVTRIIANSSKIIRKGTSFDGHWEIKE